MLTTILSVLTVLLYLISSVVGMEISLKGENVYTPMYNGFQYFLFIAQKEATITCSVTGLEKQPEISFLKENKKLSQVLPSSLYKLISGQSDDGTYYKKLTIDASGYSDIEGNWTCSVVTTNDRQQATFKTLCTEKPSITFTPKLVRGVAREGSTVTIKCNCDFLDELDGDRSYSWLIDNASPAGGRIFYKGTEDGSPTSELGIIDLDATDTADYSCACKIGKHVELNSLAEKMSVMKPPGTPDNLHMINSSMNYLTVGWDDSEGIGLVLEFKISYKKKSSPAYKEVSTGIKHNYYTIHNLDSLTDYDVKVAAANNAGSGRYTKVTTFRTAQPTESVPSIVEPEGLPVTDNNFYMLETSPGMNVALTCKVNAYPKPMITWMFNNRQIQLNGASSIPANYDNSIKIESDFTTKFVLRIMSASTANDGAYSCIATNAKGIDQINFSVEVLQESGENEAERSTSGHIRSYTLSANLTISVLILYLLCR